MIRNILRHQCISRQDIGDRRCGLAFDSMCYMPVDQVFVKSVCDALSIQSQSRISLIRYHQLDSMYMYVESRRAILYEPLSSNIV